MKKSALRVGLACALLASACRGAHDESDKLPTVATLYELDLREAMPEQGLSLLGETKPGLADALLKVRALLDQPLVKGLFVRIGALEGRFGDLADWAATFDAFRAAKRPVHCHLDSADNLGFALASHCDRISMTPSGMLNLVGVGAQVIHGRALLALLGVQADLLQVGKYKGAAEPFTRDTLSTELRESLEGLLTDLDQTFQRHLSRDGKLDAEQLRAALNGGPYSADEAKAKNLIDALSFDDEARAIAKKTVRASALRQVFPEHEEQTLALRDLLALLTTKEEPIPAHESRLALVYLVGEIVDGDGTGRGRSASDPFVKAMRRFADDSRVRAVVLRIESPGGSALASDRMWHAVRRAAARKPVVVSVGDMAASGGYYVASAGTRILANEGSVIGSIGVVGGKMVLANMADKVGLHVTPLPRAAHASWLSPLAPFTAEERDRLQSLLSRTYQLFLERVSLGRKRSIEQLEPAAEGRVMGGARAKELGLVDELGGLTRAIALARELGKLDKGAKISRWPDLENPLAALGSMLGARQQQVELVEQLTAETSDLPAVVKSALLRACTYNQARALTSLPFQLILR